MYDTIIFEFDYSKDGTEYDINARVYLEDNSILIDRKYKESNDAIATQRIRYVNISDVDFKGSKMSITFPKGTAYLKTNDADLLKEFYDKLMTKI